MRLLIFILQFAIHRNGRFCLRGRDDDQLHVVAGASKEQFGNVRRLFSPCPASRVIVELDAQRPGKFTIGPLIGIV